MRFLQSYSLGSGKADLSFLWLAAMLLGAGLLASAAVSWIAANWPYASDFQKLAGTQLALAANALLACWWLWRCPAALGAASLSANALGLAAVLAGALLALIGQTYQTGADPWQLFAVWAALLLPWSLAMPTVFMLCLLATVANAALALFLHRELDWSWTSLAAGLVVLNLSLLALRELAQARLQQDDPWRIVPRAVMMAVAGWWLAGLLMTVFQNQSYGLALGWPGLLLGVGLAWAYTRARPDAAMLSLLGLTACLAFSIVVLERLGLEAGLFVVIVMLVLAFIFGARYLLVVAHAGKAQRHTAGEPWFISAFRLVLMGLAVLMCLSFAELVLDLDKTSAAVVGALLAAAGLWGLRARFASPAWRDLSIVLLAVGYGVYGFCVMATAGGRTAGQVALVALPAALIYALAPVFVLRLFSALIGLGVVVLYLWSGPSWTGGWPGGSSLLSVPDYERVLALSLAALAAWRWISGDEGRQGHAPLGWALACLALLFGWWAPALPWGAVFQGAPWAWVLGLVLAALPLYALAALTRGAGRPLGLGAALVLLGASIGWLGAPGVAVALTWLLMGRVLGRPALLGLGAVALLTYLAQFYYELDTSLLHKAWVLGATGAWILLGAMALAAYRQGWRWMPASEAPSQSAGRRWRPLAVLAGLLVILAVANGTILQRERVIELGKPVVLQLAPVDPRSLMQGDYMALRYQVAGEAEAALKESPALAEAVRVEGGGVLLLAPDADGVHRLRRVEPASGAAPERSAEGLSGEAAGGMARLAFRLRGGQIQVGTDAWFFPEGQGEHYARARYGLFQVDGDGDGVLVDLLDEQRQGLKGRAPLARD